MAMRHRAWLAWRLPDRLSRWRTTFPGEASIGETPQRAANAASLFIRSGLSPAATNPMAATSTPTPVVPRQSSQPKPGCRQGIRSFTSQAKARAAIYPLCGEERAQHRAQLLERVDDQVPDLESHLHLGAEPASRSEGHAQYPDRLDDPALGLWNHACLAA